MKKGRVFEDRQEMFKQKTVYPYETFKKVNDLDKILESLRIDDHESNSTDESPDSENARIISWKFNLKTTNDSTEFYILADVLFFFS